MKHEELAALLAEPTTPLVRAALRGLPPKTLETLATVADQAAEQGWRQVVVDRVRIFAAEQPGGGPQAVTAYFTTTEQRAGSGMSVGWSPFIAALAPTEEMPDLRHTETTARMVPVGEAARAEEDFAARSCPKRSTGSRHSTRPRTRTSCASICRPPASPA
ncbi:hypothetical protein [Streptomyces sp. MCC20]|uniref:hypothetical protein n=1 Tax=Streptomyces sediminimaris TaxID=3383721 RepID=UPI00399C2AEE